MATSPSVLRAINCVLFISTTLSTLYLPGKKTSCGKLAGKVALLPPLMVISPSSVLIVTCSPSLSTLTS
ncbi:hypothetical protein D3C78_1974700 [compost metagenome]